MKPLKSPTLYSRLALITSVTLVVGYLVVYAAWTNLDLVQVQSGEKITSALMQNILNKINDIGTRTDGIYSSAGNIGIGTASPGTSLDVAGHARIQGGSLHLGASTAWNNNIYVYNTGIEKWRFGNRADMTDQFQLMSNTWTTAVLSATQSWNVWIWTTNPWAQLDVQGTVNIKDTLRQGNITTYVTTISAGASSATYPILRQFHDSANWGNGGALIEEFTHYYSYATFDYGMFFASYGYSGNSAGILTKVSGAIAPVWGAATLISGTYYYRDLSITLPAYYQMRIRITTPMPITTNLTGAQASKIYLY